MLRALRLIGDATIAPLERARISLEPRYLAPGDPTAWDIAVRVPSSDPKAPFGTYVTERIEAKLNPTRADVLEWICRVKQAAGLAQGDAFQLVCGSWGVPVLKNLSDLTRVAREVGSGNAELPRMAEAEFARRLAETADIAPERPTDTSEIVRLLNPGALWTLMCMRITPRDEDTLEDDLLTVARTLTNDVAAARQLVDLLYRKFDRGAGRRLSFDIPALVAEVRRANIPLEMREVRAIPGLHPDAFAALAILQTCQRGVPAEDQCGLPLEILVAAVRLPSLEQELAPLVEKDVVQISDGLCTVAPLTARLGPLNAAEARARTLEKLLGYIEQHPGRAACRQIRNAAALAEACGLSHPELVAGVFRRLDKPCKVLGDKRFVLKLARLSITAAEAIPSAERSEEVLKGEAQALICGVSWALQRFGELEQATGAARESLRLGRRLVALAGDGMRVEDAVVRIAGRTLAGIACPPTDLDALFGRLGVISCEADADLPVSGALRRTAVGYAILYGPGLTGARRRFTIAHELAHVLLDDGRRNPAHAGRELERLCDMLATELLLPRDEFLARSGSRPGVAVVGRLADLFKTSLTATAIRCAELTGASAMEVMNDSVLWAHGPVRRMRDELVSVVHAAMAGPEVTADVTFYERGLNHLWRVEGRPLGRDGNRALLLLRPIKPSAAQ